MKFITLDMTSSGGVSKAEGEVGEGEEDGESEIEI